MDNLSAAQEEQWWQRIDQDCANALATHGRHFVTLECCANHRNFAKPDTMKWLVLWELDTSTPGLRISKSEDLDTEHAWLSAIFLPSDQVVRFPCNSGDCDGVSLYWLEILNPVPRPNWSRRIALLPRFSTASRSNLALIPNSEKALKLLGEYQPTMDAPLTLGQPGNRFDGFRFDLRSKVPSDPLIGINRQEWEVFEESGQPDARAVRAPVSIPDVGEAASSDGVAGKGGKRFRLYSVKTGVSFVGSTAEGLKRVLEDSSELAMLRSKIIRRADITDADFGIQTEVLTITALNNGNRPDGFQVRELSCLRPGLDYIPTTAIPYVRGTYDGLGNNIAQQRDFWRRNFAVPLGRAKARLFLNFGLIHSSANAQNFLLGFNADNALQQLVVRDVADTSWHNFYLLQVSSTKAGIAAFAAYTEEASQPFEQSLRPKCSTNYQSPRMLRLAAHSVVTHGFDQRLMNNQGGAWTSDDVYHFNRGVIDGFKALIEEVFGLKMYPETADEKPAGFDALVQTAGTVTAYPYPGSHEAQAAYEEKHLEYLGMESDTLLHNAAYLSRHGTTLTPQNPNQVHGTCEVLINAEEVFLCAAIEKRIRQWGEDSSADQEVRARLAGFLNGAADWPAIVTD